ncbi:MAG: membrane protein insertion efficiency factor YidD [Flavobacteriales bacterium]|nr:membrane protein insertion efficiency factor YidD [Flavobacteriales bacterium]
MSWLLRWLIRAYWALVPERSRRTCLFKESCSRYVYRMALEHGARAGWKALVGRYRQCRSGYTFVERNGNVELKTAGGVYVPMDELVSALFSRPGAE